MIHLTLGEARGRKEGGTESSLDDHGGILSVDRQQHGARVVIRADTPEPVCSEPSDESDMGQRLDVLDQCGTTADPTLANGRQPGEGGHCTSAATELVDDSGLLTGEESSLETLRPRS